MSAYLILLFSLLTCFCAVAQEQVNIEKLSQNSHWLKLLHYSDHTFKKTQSDIVTSSFFLSTEGQSNPKEELLATIEGLKSSQVTYCRFPARRQWLEKMGFSFPSQKCEGFHAWTRGHSIKSVSLIFATGFLGNPASYFGHPLLKFNFKDNRSPLDLMDTAINYGAFTPPNVDAFAYGVKGIFGGYEAGFTSAEFFFQRGNYSEVELRDMWEYELVLNQNQVDELIAHVWEMQEAKIPYYFFDDNCAYRISELLEIVTNKELIQRGIPFALPTTLFHKAYDLKLVKDVKLIKSRQTRLREKFSSLSPNEKKHLRLLAKDSDYLKTNEFNALSVDEKSRILEVGLDYYAFQISMDKDQDLIREKKELLKARLNLPSHHYEWQNISQRPPHEAQKPIFTTPGYFHSEEFGSGASLRFRPALYDLISPDTGRPVYSSLAIFDLELNMTSDKLWIKQFNFISVENLNISKTKLKNDGGLAWKFNAGADQLNLACNTCLVPKLEAGVGIALEISKYLLISGMIEPRLQSQYQGSGFVIAKPVVSALITFSEDFRINTSVGRRFYLDSDYKAESIYLVEGRIGSSRHWDLRVSYQEHVDRRYGLGLGIYW